ncbi:MAP/microtubule affinity-regulating kinase 4 [Choanephora cucurbitarum]|uniref:MAP/microtubule affinity-regulating kinase 4 n=1 Tax=Choanephora cucurbitarum TaxID=101091 RepID=A0A1C7NI32_9FUNG|nr:MAP/microtubule affinity-regulating kinase 4 [Choanephora cucurbitarum]
MISSPRNSVAHNQQAKLAVDYNELLKELSSHEMTSVGCYTIGETIGEGTFGKVKKGTHKLTGKLVAIKKISKQHAPMMAREIHHHRQLKHPNIVMLYEMITTESAIHIISEYCPSGDLLDALTDAGRCSEIRVHKWFRQLADAIHYCHLRGIVHRDLKLENILLDSEDNVKICDFGFARFTQKNQYLETFCGSLSYSAPEVIMRKKYTGPETDIWSLGVILYTLIAGEYPFDDDSEVMTQRKIVQVDYTIPFYFSTDLNSLITNMLQFNPCDRISFEAMETHPWVVRLDHLIDDDGEDEEDEDTCLTPSSSTTTHQSTASDVDSIFSQNESTVALDDGIDYNTLSPDLKFSPQVRSSLGISKPQAAPKSSRFSAPTFNRRTPQPTSFRSSLPSSFYQSNAEQPAMTPVEQRLFAALTAAGFDRDALIKMQTGECDTSSTLWHLLLENMSNQPQPAWQNFSVPDAFASAMQQHRIPTTVDTHPKKAVDQGTQTFQEGEEEEEQKEEQENKFICQQKDTNDQLKTDTVLFNTIEPAVQPYPKPTVSIPYHSIPTVGFGSPQPTPERAGWFSSVKSWFGSKPPPSTASSISPSPQRRGRSASTCSTMSSPIATPSSYRNFDTPVDHSVDTNMMSPPIYRTGSQKYRRRVLQLSDPPVCELDQLTYNGTTAIPAAPAPNTTNSPITITHPKHNTNNTTTSNTHTTSITKSSHTTTSNSAFHTQNAFNYRTPSSLDMPPVALTSTRLATDTFSILTTESSEPKEIDICQRRYSLLYSQRQQHHPTPPSSPPALDQHCSEMPSMVLSEENHVEMPLNAGEGKEPLSDFSSDSSTSEEDEEMVVSTPAETVAPQPPLTSSFALKMASTGGGRPRNPRFEFTPRSRLTVYGMQEQKGPSFGSKAIIEEEEEEEE